MPTIVAAWEFLMPKTLKVIILKGLPGSGKTKYAKELQAREPGRWKRVNKDDLRAMIDDGKWSKEREKFILDMRDEILVNALGTGYNVIVDDTNFEPKHEATIRELVKLAGQPVDVDVVFINTPLEKCILQDACREKQVGEKVIRDMHKRYLAQRDSVPEPAKQPWNPALPTAIICDLDGTLALRGERSWFDWLLVGCDKLNEPVAEVLRRFKDHKLIVTSGRKSICYNQSSLWLLGHGFTPSLLLLRADADNRPDEVVKREMYENCIKDQYNILFVLDDRDRVVKMWREQGLPCFQVNYGNF